MRRTSSLRIGVLASSAIAFALALHGCGGKDKNPVAPGGDGGGGADVTINIVANNAANSYSPNPDTVMVGQTVSWKNIDTITHTATDDAVAFGTGGVNPGATSTPIAMNSAGTFTYHCTIHPGMVGTLVVK